MNDRKAPTPPDKHAVRPEPPPAPPLKKVTEGVVPAPKPPAPETDRPRAVEDVLKLYEIATELEAAIDAIEAAGGELTPDVEDALSSWDEAFDRKVERTVHVIRNFEATAEAIKKEAQRLTALASARSKVADSLRDYLRNQMQRIARDRVDLTTVTVRRVRHHTPSIKWTAVGDPPPSLTRTEVKLDSGLVKAAWQADALPDGFEVSFSEYIVIK